MARAIPAFANGGPVGSMSNVTIQFPGVPPIVSCVFLLLPAVFLSGLFHGNFELVQETMLEYVKVLIYFVLMISLVNRWLLERD